MRGIREMVQAIALLPESLNARLLLAGNFQPPALEQQVRCMVGWERVDYLGWLSRNEVAATYAQSCVGLVVLHPNPNYLESYPVKLFEYMAAGVPVIASDFPLWRQIVEEAKCGLLVDPLKPEAIAAATLWMMEHESEANAMGERGRHAVLTQYNWEIEAQKLTALYSGIGSRG
jgi:glycosyltransferase involved in cell wall biosynthesis